MSVFLEPGENLREGKEYSEILRQVTRSLATRTDTLCQVCKMKKGKNRSSNIELGASQVEVVVKSRLPMQEDISPKSGLNPRVK